MPNENRIISLVMFMYRIDGGAQNLTFNPGPHKGGSKSFPILVDRNDHIDFHRNVAMVKSDLETFKAYFERSEPFQYTKNGSTIIPQQIGYITYKVLVQRDGLLVELGSSSWNRQEGRWKENKKV